MWPAVQQRAVIGSCSLSSTAFLRLASCRTLSAHLLPALQLRSARAAGRGKGRARGAGRPKNRDVLSATAGPGEGGRAAFALGPRGAALLPLLDERRSL